MISYQEFPKVFVTDFSRFKNLENSWDFRGIINGLIKIKIEKNRI